VSIPGPGGLEIASLKRRLLARLIDAAAFLIPAGVAGAGGFGLLTLYQRWRGGGSDSDEAPFPFEEQRFGWFRRTWESPAGRLGWKLASLPLDVRTRNWRSPGDRVMGLRRVDVRTGGPVSVRSALIKEAVQITSSELNLRLQRPFEQRRMERVRAVRDALREAREIHAGDKEAQARAAAEILKRTRVRPWATCSRGMLGGVPLQIPALFSARNQSLPDRLAGIVTVRE
jgi:RDD family